MADIGDVCNALVNMVQTALYPNGVSAGSPLGVNFRIYRGHPVADQLDSDIQAGYTQNAGAWALTAATSRIVNVCINPRAGVGRLVRPYTFSAPQSAAIPAQTLTATVGTVGAGMTMVMYADNGSVLNTQTLKAAFSAGLACPGITRVLLTMRWSDAEVTPGVYSFATLLAPYLALVPAGVQLELALLPGIYCPTWLTASTGSGGMGCSFVSLVAAQVNGNTETINYANPDDPIYYTRWTSVNAALASYALGAALPVSEVRLTYCCGNDDEVCILSWIGGAGNPGQESNRYDPAWAALGYTPASLTTKWTNYVTAMAGYWPSGVKFSLPFYDPNTGWPRVDNTGTVQPTEDTTSFAESLFAAAVAAAPGRVGAMQNTMSASPPPSYWYTNVAAGGLPYGQIQETGSQGNFPTPAAFAAVLQEAFANGITVLEIHQDQCGYQPYQGLIAQYAQGAIQPLASGNAIGLAGTVSAGQGVAVSANGIVVGVTAGSTDTLETLATSLAAALTAAGVSATAAGQNVTVSGTPVLYANGFVVAPTGQEVERQVQGFDITIYAPGRDLRDAVSAAIKPVFSATQRFVLPDGFQALMRSAPPIEVDDDRPEKALLFVRKIYVQVEYATVLAGTAPTLALYQQALNAGGDSLTLVTT